MKRRHHDRDSGTVYALDQPDFQVTRRCKRPRIPSRDYRIELALRRVNCHLKNRRVALGPQRLDGRFVHPDHLRAVHNFDARLAQPECLALVLEHIARSVEKQLVAGGEVLQAGKSAVNDLSGSMVTAHPVDRNPHGSLLRLVPAHLELGMGVHVPAAAAGRVGQLRLAALRAGNQVYGRQSVVRAPCALAGTDRSRPRS